MLTQSELERERYQARLKAMRDLSSMRKDFRAEGRAEGLQKGTLIGRIQLCERLLKRPSTPFEKLEALPVDELTALTEQLEKDL